MKLEPEEKKLRQKERLQKLYNEQHKIIDNILYKKCNKHNIYFPNEDEWILCDEEHFYKNKSNGLDGLYPICKKCDKIKSINYIKANKNECCQRRKNWYRDNKEKELLNNKKYIEKPPF